MTLHSTWQRYWHTLRYLRPVQVYGRLWFRVYRPRAALLGLDAPKRRPRRAHVNLCASQDTGEATSVFPRLRRPSMVGPTRFRFLNQTHDVLGPDAWNDPTRDKLWLYNLHYFDDLNAEEAPARADWHGRLIQRWIVENPPSCGNGWEPYPTSLRIVNWVKYCCAESAWQRGAKESGAEVCSGPLPLSATSFATSLAIQVRWLCKRLEHHLLGNHLLANAKALVFAGAFFDGTEAERWLRLGSRLLIRELDEQILPDGGHFERSPMYHAILLEDVLDVVRLAEVYPGALDETLLGRCREKAGVMLHWLAAMTHPDGEISFFNDAAFGIAPTLANLQAYAKQLGIAVLSQRGIEQKGLDICSSVDHLPDSGYVRLQAGPAVGLLDCAPIGPDYLPGHAHADTLSFELSLFGQRVIVNGGTSRYGIGPERLAERGTAAHSTVQIDGVDSSEVWGGFRVARRARPFDVQVRGDRAHSCAEAGDVPSSPGIEVSAAHDGYCRLPGKPVHRRSWLLTEDYLRVTDRIEGAAGHLGRSIGCQALGDSGEPLNAVARFHLHPSIEASIDGQRGTLRLLTGQCLEWKLSGGTPRLTDVHWHPEFGRSIPSRCLEIRLHQPEATFELRWD